MELSLPQMSVPAPTPKLPERPPQDNVPQTQAQRERIKALVDDYVVRHNPVPPQPIAQLREHSEALLNENGIDTRYTEYTAVLINNRMWRDQLAAVPYERRLLLLPKCLRKEATCPAPFDEFGLLCKQCGQCSLQDLQEEAERMGYAVLIAEGSAVVMKLIETGKIEAIVGVSCLSVLERAFPYMESAAIPGVAIPLLQDDCKDTNVDLEWVWDAIHLTSDDKTYRMDLDDLRHRVDAWFSDEQMDRLLGEATTETEQIARRWLSKTGKRWRPFLTTCAAQALREDPTAEIPDDLKKIAIAVECFHKASLVHDDIEDGDNKRYDEATVHAEHGIPVALNVGDLLLGEGYRLIGEVDLPGDRIAQMLRVASAGHRDLSLGQGTELCWERAPHPLKATQVLEVFRRKTAPAFEVALRLGAIYAGADDDVHDVLKRYSENLGIAYQIRDDLDDWTEGDGLSDMEAMRPTLLPAIAHDKASGEEKQLLAALWSRSLEGDDLHRARSVMSELGVEDRARDLLDAYKEEAVRSLRVLETPTLKGLLRRVMGKIFNDLVIEGWCKEFEQQQHQAQQESAQAQESEPQPAPAAHAPAAS